MKESIIQVASIIKEAVPQYRKEGISVAARVHGNFDGSEESYWFLVTPMINMYELGYLKKYGHLIPKNSSIATRILNEEVGIDIEYSAINTIKRLQKHHIKATSKADLGNQIIYLIDCPQGYKYDNLDVFLQGLRNNQEKIEVQEQEIKERELEIENLQKQENTAHQRSVLTKGLQKMKEMMRILTLQQEEMAQLTKYIRKQGQLRFNPILDPIQNRIKTKNLFNGVTIVIDGGPGTGKTTTMIQRLKYLTDWYAIEEDARNGTGWYKLSASQREHLHKAIENHRDWVFFSPSELLKEYLQAAMNSEGLTNTIAKVWSWDLYRNKIVRENYLLIDPTNENAPFKTCRSHEKLFNNGGAVINNFTTFFLGQLQLIKTRFPKIETDGKLYKWSSIALGIQQRFDGCESFSLHQFIQLFNSLENLYRTDCLELIFENRNRVKSIADELFILSQEKLEVYEQLIELAKVQTTESSDDEQDEQDVDENESQQVEGIDSKVPQMIRKWFKRYCYNKKNPDARLTTRQEKLSELLLPILTDSHKEQIDRVGELALFEQFAKYTRGIVSNLFGGFAAKYKRFRRQALSGKDAAWNLVELEALLKRREGKELHPQEQSLLIGFINNLVKLMKRVSSNSLNHTFVTAYNELARPIIGIDEATDFNECDIYAMQSLLYNDYNSLTICGDLMQRLTPTGITSWEDIRPYVEGMHTEEMKTSYRQSTSLLKIAQKMFHDTLGYFPNYKAYMKMAKVPTPLAYISEDENDKIHWIEKRISEVYLAYGKQLPSIAIFLNDKNSIRSFVEELRETDFIIDSAIEVVDGSEGNVLASSNQIRVYPINVVKGMEFDVVFFHNIDKTTIESELIKRYIYVGVSRAAFFLGVTLNSDDKEITQYFTINSNWSRT